MQPHSPERQRRLALEGAFHFRDLGGYDVRADARRAGAAAAIRLARRSNRGNFQLLEPLGPSILIDFRLAMEREHKPNRLPPGSTIEMTSRIASHPSHAGSSSGRGMASIRARV
jgi:Tyrosine phosphatase family